MAKNLPGAIAQLGEHLHGMQEVGGSRPPGSIAFFSSAKVFFSESRTGSRTPSRRLRHVTRIYGFCCLVFLFMAADAACVATANAPSENALQQPRVEVAGKIFQVEVVSASAKRALGLSGRTQLENNQGMLFIFEQDARHRFWMKNMSFSLDIAWISKFGSVVHMERHVSPESWPKSFAPSKAARYVLEVPAGQLSHVAPGDRVRFEKVPIQPL